MVASSGPMDSSSSTPSSIFSYLRFSRSTRYIFFSISSLRWRISSWYFSISRSLALRSSRIFDSVPRSCTACASVLSLSMLMRLISFSRLAMSNSTPCRWSSTSTDFLFRFLTALEAVICRFFSSMMLFSILKRSRATVWMELSRLSICTVRSRLASSTSFSSASVVASERCSSAKRSSRSSRSAWIFCNDSSTNLRSLSSFSLRARMASCANCTARISRFTPSSSMS
mmetsp:Transcript_9156/g.26751  ORF Transcript_9156/g.26751 Transcript_9156/m.26751 type:complete len:228 (-) Transcript_9156:1041-1724(-)